MQQLRRTISSVGMWGVGALGGWVAERLSKRAEIFVSTLGRSTSALEQIQRLGLTMLNSNVMVASQIQAAVTIVPVQKADYLVRELVEEFSAQALKPVFLECSSLSRQTTLESAAKYREAGGLFGKGVIIGGRGNRLGRPHLIYAGSRLPEFEELLSDAFTVVFTGSDLNTPIDIKVAFEFYNKGQWVLYEQATRLARSINRESLFSDLLDLYHPAEALRLKRLLRTGRELHAERFAREVEILDDELRRMGVAIDLAKLWVDLI